MRLLPITVLPLALLLGLAVLVSPARPQPPADKMATARIILPLNRTAYQTNESIDVSVVREGAKALSAGELALTVSGDDGSKLAFTFPVRAVPVRGKKALATEHLHLNAYLLRPGRYAIEAAVDGAKATAKVEVFSHLRRSDFKLINWGRASGKAQLVQGEDSLGFNLFYGHYGKDSAEANFLRAGVDFMANCTMSGAHQMDIRSECDWADPYVTRGGTVRVVRQALQDRTRGNVLGVHFYDEPGLTWLKHPITGETTPHMIPAQVRSFKAAFNEDPLSYHLVDPKNPEHVKRWAKWARWKLAFMDAAWKEAQFGVSFVRSDFLSTTQSQYGWSAFTDGYYFNVVRSLPITSGHGGYDDYGPGFFNPSFTLEMARARDHWKPCWYLPTWYGNTPADRFRLEQYLSFQTNIQGMTSPPDLEPATNPNGRQGIVESNRLMQRLGPIFTTMPVTKPPVAMLYSLSQAIHTQTKDMQANYVHAMPQGINLPLTYLAGKLIQQQFLPLVEEDVLDGTLAGDHQAIVLTSLDYLDKKVIAALEDFAGRGGKVLLTGDCKVKIKGAIDLKVVPRMPEQEAIDKLMKAKKYNEARPYTTTTKWFAGATPLAKAIKAELAKAGIKPIFQSDVPTIVATRQAAGDVEYLFAVNATHDGSLEKNAVAPASATLTLEKDGGPVYDALVVAAVPGFEAKGKALTGKFRFGPGQMRVFARTARPIGGVKAGTPAVVRELVKEKEPIRVELSATLLDDKGRPLSGSAPLHVRVRDPLGVTRFELYRATKLGQWSMALPLAANDAAGRWTVSVRDLLGNTEDTVHFNYAPPARAAAVAGMTRRAVAFGNDLDNVFRFARLHRDVTIVKGTSAYHAAAAERLSKALRPWGVRCSVVDVKTAGKPRSLSAEEAPTWIGLVPGKAKSGNANGPNVAGFAVHGHVILLGNAEDNTIIKYLLENKFLPYVPKAGELPGVGRGMIAWQRDGVGHGQESVALIAHDEEGLSEAVGTFYEAVAGLERLTKRALPGTTAMAPAKTAPGLLPVAAVAWTVNLPDRVVALKATAGRLKALTHDGSLVTLSAAGKVTGSKALESKEVRQQEKNLAPGKDAAASEAAKGHARPDRMMKLTASQGGKVAIAYWGGTLRVVDGRGKARSEQLLAQDVTALTWVDGKVVAGLANGQVVALRVE